MPQRSSPSQWRPRLGRSSDREAVCSTGTKRGARRRQLCFASGRALLGFAILIGVISTHEVAFAEPPAVVDTDKPKSDQISVDFKLDIQPILTAHCTACHGASDQNGGLRLDHRTLALQGGDTGPAIVPHKMSGELLRRITSDSESELMPPPEGGKALSKEQIAKLRTWIQQGAVWPDDGQKVSVTSNHWAYQPRRSITPPQVQNETWIRSPIDRFVLNKLEAARITPSPEADKETLQKRLFYDLIGLPPTLEEIDAFQTDESPDAYEKLVDRLLASPHFGERWGRHWLDKARYADSDGYEKDNARPDAFHYRDWVINAFNRDLPFDQFTIEQLAGDLLPDATEAQRIATAFHRQTMTNTEGGTDPEEFRVVAVVDRTNTTASVWLGLTAGCAQCHTHKYDQITQLEYYQLYAFFNNGDEINLERSKGPEAIAEYEKQLAAHEAKLKNLNSKLDALKKKKEAEAASPTTATDTVATSAPAAPVSAIDADIEKIQKQIDQTTKRPPAKPIENIRILTQRTESSRKTHVLKRGDFLDPGTEVQPGTFGTLHPFQTRNQSALPDRLDLAQWLVSADNPLTPRVTVNRIWGHLFGRGLVKTMDDFGVRGEQPTHAELLDWLSDEFLRLKWSQKALIREIVLSATYRQASAHRPELLETDPLNEQLARQNRFRVEGEIVRDLHLAASGLLNRTVGGPSVFPPMPADVAALSYANNFKWKTSEGNDLYRRGMYIFFKRTAPFPDLMTFDCPDSNVATIERRSSNTPLMALTTLNNQVFSETASAMASRLLKVPVKEPTHADTERLTTAFCLCVVRPPDQDELQSLLALLNECRSWYRTHPEDAKKLINNKPIEGLSADEQSAWIATVRIVMNMDEFIMRE
ncbi:DUF1549 domain-containing protein [Planctomicrobium sp. SH527]|uniref:PSD1 and planctomycete cytochrome C domain-containing protein n=1 Tax=Planctomicrobium sp. SH527 TaxID=3448123 RepID=UPI003F5C7B3B